MNSYYDSSSDASPRYNDAGGAASYALLAPDWAGREPSPIDLKQELLNSDMVRVSRWLGRKAVELYRRVKERLHQAAAPKEIGAIATAGAVVEVPLLTEAPGCHALEVRDPYWELDSPLTGTGTVRGRHASHAVPRISVEYVFTPTPAIA